jgi:hypothetical protein
MRGFVVYESLFGNTARIAQAIVEGMKNHFDVELHGVGEGVRPEGADLLVVGGPTHAFSMSRPATREDAVNQGATADPTIGLREWLEDLPDGNDTAFAAFDTRVDMVRRLPGSAAKAAAKAAAPRSGAHNSPSRWSRGLEIGVEPDPATTCGRLRARTANCCW